MNSPRPLRRCISPCLLALLLLWAPCLAAADLAARVLRVALPHAEAGFDPATASEVYSAAVIAGIMEPLLTFDYLARPPRLVPLTAESLPVIEDGGRTWTFRLRRGIHFTDDPAFAGKRRELTAADYAYAIKRLVDPATRSPNAFHVAGKIVGLDELAAAAHAGRRFDYDARIEGIETVGRHILRIRLKQPDHAFAFVMALPALSAVAHEAVATYGERIAAHPVGTGPYRLKTWIPASRIVLEANPGFRGLRWEFEPGDDPEDARIAAAMRGKTLPRIGTVEFHVLEEPQAQWLAMLGDKVDIGGVPDAFVPMALRGQALAPDLARRGLRLSRLLQPAITYTAFNMRDPTVGGFGEAQVALRRAMAMAYDNAKEVRVVRMGQAIVLPMPIPPGVPGHSLRYLPATDYDPARANRLLDEAGYRRGRDGYRSRPDGGPLVIRYASQRDTSARDFQELWRMALDAIGVRLVVEQGSFGDQIKAAATCAHQMWSYGWTADYPDGDSFMQLLFGDNVHASNVACYASPAFDALYRESRRIADSPERTQLFERMTRQFEADAPWRLHVATYRNVLAQARVIGYKPHPYLFNDWMYADIEEPVPRR